MDRQGIIEALVKLAQLEIDVNHTYGLAVKSIDDPVMRQRLEEFQRQHEDHISQLSEEIRALGGSAPELSPDIRGYLISGVTSLLSTTGASGALQALKLGEELTTGRYEDALKWDVPEGVRRLIRRHFSDEKIHLDYATNNLKALKA